MSVACVNLLAAPRYRAVRRREILRPWSMCMIGIIVLGVMAWGWMGTSQARMESVTTELSVLRTSVSTLEEQGKAREDRIARLAQQEAAAQAVGHHPNWSILFQHVARARGEEIVLERCDLSPTRLVAPSQPATSGTPAHARQAAEYLCTIQGVAVSNKAVREYVIRLEESGLFDGVKLEEQQSRSDGEKRQTVTTFTIACRLKEHTEVGK